MNPRMRFAVAAALALGGTPTARAQQTPFIDDVLKELETRAEDSAARRGSETPFIDRAREEMRKEQGGPPAAESYIERARREDPSLAPGAAAPAPTAGEPGLIEREKKRIEAEKTPPVGGAIQAHREGRDQLQLKREGRIRFAAGFRINATTDRDYSSTSTGGASYQDLYGGRRFPDFTLLFEWQPWHSEWVGNVGVVGQVGYSQQRGTASLSVALPKPWGGGSFDTTGVTRTTLAVIPVSGGLNFRLNTLRLFRPYVQAMGTAFYYAERRSDGGDTRSSYSLGYTVGGGVNVLLDWISGDSSWELYQDQGIKHYYLTLDYSRAETLKATPVTIATSALSVGFTFEF